MLAYRLAILGKAACEKQDFFNEEFLDGREQ